MDEVKNLREEHDIITTLVGELNRAVEGLLSGQEDSKESLAELSQRLDSLYIPKDLSEDVERLKELVASVKGAVEAITYDPNDLAQVRNELASLREAIDRPAVQPVKETIVEKTVEIRTLPLTDEEKADMLADIAVDVPEAEEIARDIESLDEDAKLDYETGLKNKPEIPDVDKKISDLRDEISRTASTRRGGGNVEVFVGGQKIGSGQGINFQSGFTATHDGSRVNVSATATGGGAVESVTGLNTDNTDPTNPIVKISVDGSTITGQGTPADPLVATADLSGYVPYTGADQTLNLGLQELRFSDGSNFGGIRETGSALEILTRSNNALISFLNQITNVAGIFDFSQIDTSDKVFTFPNTTGTIALTSDIPSLTSAVIVDPSSSSRNVIQSTADATELTVKSYSGQTADLLQAQTSAGDVKSRITSGGNFSNNQGYSTGEAFGARASISDGASLAVGDLASAGQYSVALGYSSTASYTDVGIGRLTSATGGEATAVGHAATASHNRSTVIGAGSSSGGSNTVTVGYNISANKGVAVGASLTSSGNNGVVIGGSSTQDGTRAVAIGYGTQALGEDAIAIGFNAVADGGDTSIAIGRGSVASNKTFVAGSDGYAMENVYFGGGVSNATPEAYTINGTGGSGTNVAGADISIAAGKGTGNAASGSLLLKTSDATTSGSTQQSLTTKAYVGPTGDFHIAKGPDYTTGYSYGNSYKLYFDNQSLGSERTAYIQVLPASPGSGYEMKMSFVANGAEQLSLGNPGGGIIMPNGVTAGGWVMGASGGYNLRTISSAGTIYTEFNQLTLRGEVNSAGGYDVVIKGKNPFGTTTASNIVGFYNDTTAMAAVSPAGDFVTKVAGGGLSIKEGTDAKMGTATLSGGTVTVNTTKVTANSRIFLTVNGGTLTNVGSPYVSARTAGTSFTITSTNASDASDVAWMIVEPA